MYCRNCGNKIPEGYESCPNCGYNENEIRYTEESPFKSVQYRKAPNKINVVNLIAVIYFIFWIRFAIRIGLFEHFFGL